MESGGLNAIAFEVTSLKSFYGDAELGMWNPN